MYMHSIQAFYFAAIIIRLGRMVNFVQAKAAEYLTHLL